MVSSASAHIALSASPRKPKVVTVCMQLWQLSMGIGAKSNKGHLIPESTAPKLLQLHVSSTSSKAAQRLMHFCHLHLLAMPRLRCWCITRMA